MQSGRLGTLVGFGLSAIGAGIALVDPPMKGAGWTFITLGVCVIALALPSWIYSNRKLINAWAARVGTVQIILLAGLVGTWLSMTAAFGAAAWIIWNGGAVLGAQQSSQDEGPLKWFYNVTLEGGFGRNIFSLTFPGTNASQHEVKLKEAHIRSAINGTELALEVDAGKDGIVPVDQISLVPSGAPIKLIAKFNLPNGLTPAEFLANWAKFNLVVKDDTKEYRLSFNEATLAVFFPGMVGPHVSKKPSTDK